MEETEEELKNLLMRVKEESEKAGLKLNIQKTKIMASSPTTSWQSAGEKNGNSDRQGLGSKITADGDWNHEIKIWLLLGRKAMTNLDSILKKQRHHFADKDSYSQIYDFSSRELDYKEGWALNNWCFWNVVLDKTL